MADHPQLIAIVEPNFPGLVRCDNAGAPKIDVSLRPPSGWVPVTSPYRITAEWRIPCAKAPVRLNSVVPRSRVREPRARRRAPRRSNRRARSAGRRSTGSNPDVAPRTRAA
jgi:hypothetical protein